MAPVPYTIGTIKNRTAARWAQKKLGIIEAFLVNRMYYSHTCSSFAVTSFHDYIHSHTKMGKLYEKWRKFPM